MFSQVTFLQSRQSPLDDEDHDDIACQDKEGSALAIEKIRLDSKMNSSIACDHFIAERMHDNFKAY